MPLKFKAQLDDSDFQNKFRAMEATASAATARITQGFAAMGALAGAIGGGALLGGLSSEIDRLSAIKDAADSINLPIEEFQRLSFVFQQSGSDAETFQKGMAHLTESFVAARDGESKQAEAMNTLGLSLRKTNEADATGALSDIADAYMNSSDKGAAFAAIAELVGSKVAIKMIPALKDGGAELRRLAASASVASAEMVDYVEYLGDKVSAAKTEIKNKVEGGWFLIGKAAKDGFKEGAGYSEQLGLPKWMQNFTGLGGSLFRALGTVTGLSEPGGYDQDYLDKIEAAKKEQEENKKNINLEIDKQEAAKNDQAAIDRTIEMVKERAEVAKQEAEDEKSKAKALADYSAKQAALDKAIHEVNEGYNKRDMANAQALGAQINAQIQAMDDAHSKLSAGFRADPHHAVASAGHEAYLQRQADHKADRRQGITPKDRAMIDDVQKMVNAAPKNMQAMIDADSINTLADAVKTAVEKLIAK